MDTKHILCLQTDPAVRMEFGEGLARFKKELIKVGNYIKESTGQKIDVALDTLKHWVREFDRWTAAGNRLPIPLGHERANQPEANRGWVTSMFIEGNSLYGILELSDESLAKTTDVSICVNPELTDGKGIKYNNVISHVALTTQPVVGGLSGFQTLSLSLTGENTMEFLKKLAEKLGLKDATEDAVMLALDKKIVPPQEDNDSNPLVMLFSENRVNKLNTLVKGGIITPAVKDAIIAKYVTPESIALELNNGVKDDFDFICKILMENRPVKLEAISGVQSLELSNPGVKPESPMRKVVNKKRADAGLKN